VCCGYVVACGVVAVLAVSSGQLLESQVVVVHAVSARVLYSGVGFVGVQLVVQQRVAGRGGDLLGH